MPSQDAMDLILKVYRRSKKGAPRIPIHSISQAGRVIESADDILSVALRRKYGPLKQRLTGHEANSAMKLAVANTAVVCIRLLEKLNAHSTESKQLFTQEDFEKGMVLLGHVTPRSEQERQQKEALDQFENLSPNQNSQYVIHQDQRGETPQEG